MKYIQKKRRAPSKTKKKKQVDITACIDLTGPKSVARFTLDGLSESNKRVVDNEINKTLKAKINKEVKNTILDVAHRELLDRLNCEQLTKNVARAEMMVDVLKPNLLSLMGTIHAIKVSDWVEVQCTGDMLRWRCWHS
jgi:hypothetical protein